MNKSKEAYKFYCNNCGNESPKWLGKCPACGEWNTYEEEPVKAKKVIRLDRKGVQQPRPISDISILNKPRILTGMREVDRVLGGGIVPGSVVLIGGEPGIGKSTLLLQICQGLCAGERKVLYVSGEESAEQVKIRAERLGVKKENLWFVSENDIDVIEKYIGELKPEMVVVDSIQTMYREEVQSAPGSVSQVRECTAEFTRQAKTSDIVFFIVGHITKDGSLAGPKILEHIVDTVIYFEGDSNNAYRILRSAKNRFGSTNEFAMFQMLEKGLAEVENPSEIFLSKREGGVSGCAVVCSIEGTKPLFVEVQALTASTAFGMPRRVATGMDYNRLVMLIAIIEKKVGLNLESCDVYLNVAGGLRINETSIDLGVAVAIISSFKNRPVDLRTVLIGELGLGGETRGVSKLDIRIKEAEKLGFRRCLVPKVNAGKEFEKSGMEVISVEDLTETIKKIFDT